MPPTTPSLMQRIGQLGGNFVDAGKSLTDRISSIAGGVASGVEQIGKVAGAAGDYIGSQIDPQPQVVTLSPNEPEPLRPEQSQALLAKGNQEFPFTPEALTSLKSVKTTQYDPTTNDNSGFTKGTMSGAYYTPPGGDIKQYLASKGVSPNVTRVIGNALSFLDPQSISLSDAANADSANHESLNYLFHNSPMGSDPQKQQEFNDAWNKIVSRGTNDPYGDGLYAIDKQVQSFGENDPYRQASDRFAFLGTQVAKDGIQVIPPELRPYYAGIINGIDQPAQNQNTPETADRGTVPQPQPEPQPAQAGGDANHAVSVNTPAGEVIMPSQHLAPVIDKVSADTGTSSALLKTILMMESSMAYDTRSQNSKIGNYAWLTGLTDSAKADLQKAGIPTDFSTRQGALKATADFINLLQQRYPNESPKDLYFNHYFGGKVQAARKKLFDNAMQVYAGS